MTLNKKTKRLKALDGGFTGIDKTEFVRPLKVPSGLNWSASNLKVLEKCLRNVTRFEFETQGEKIMRRVWELIQTAPVLRELVLELSGAACDAFDADTRFPPIVRVLRATFDLRRNHDEFLKMVM